MALGYIKDGAPVEIVSEAVVDDVAHSLGTLMLWSEDERAAIGVMTIMPPDPAPASQRIASTELQLVQGGIQAVASYEDSPPAISPS